MRRSIFVLLTVACVSALAVYADSAEKWTVGEKWTYSHEGPMPWRPPEREIVGDRVREVIRIEGEGEEKRWLRTEKWGSDDYDPGVSYITKDGLLDKVEAGNGLISAEPPCPTSYMSLKPGEDQSWESRLAMDGGFGMTWKVKAKRAADETVTVPAGEFKNCIHVQTTEEMDMSSDTGEITVQVKRDYWYHTKVNGAVKESFSYAMGDNAIPKGTSVLKSYTKGETTIPEAAK